jgi:predicted lipid-binding transport protein (Tim44 family)
MELMMIFFAALAAFVLYQLYNVLGRRTGHMGQEADGSAKPAMAAGLSVMRESGPKVVSAVPGVEALKTQDPGFEEGPFLETAAKTYESIVSAFFRSDKDSLRPLVTDSVFAAYEPVIEGRISDNLTEEVNFIAPPRADLEHAEVLDDVARVRVRFLAEMAVKPLGHDQDTSPETRRTAEIWTFTRKVKAKEANWLLTEVKEAVA